MTKTLEILDRLVAFPSVSADSNLALIDYVDGYLTDRGFTVHRVPDPNGQKAGIYASLGPEGDGIMLSGHTDVVPVAGQDWSKDPFRLTCENGRAFGRGTTDMKGFLASVMALADRAAAAPLKEPLKIAFSYDEEVGCVGIKHMINRVEDTIGLPRLCVVGEPTEMQAAVGHKGKMALRAVCHGTNGHSALAPNFLNALHPAAGFVTSLQELQAEFARSGPRDAAYDIPYSTVHVGKMSGGTALNIVPDRAELEFELRHIAAHDPEEIVAAIRACADAVTARYKETWPEAAIDIEVTNAYPGFDIAPEHDAVRRVSGWAATNSVTKVAFGTEAGYFQSVLDIPTVVCGPGSMSDQGHKPDESIALSDLDACDAMMDRILEDLT